MLPRAVEEGLDTPNTGFGSETLYVKSVASLNLEVASIWCQRVERGGGCSFAAHPIELA